jgi:hypothetical protein
MKPVTEAGRRLLDSWGGNPEGATGQAILAIEAQTFQRAIDVIQGVGLTGSRTQLALATLDALRRHEELPSVPDGPPGEIAEVYGK